MADDGYRGYGGDNGRGRGGTEPPTDPLTDLARLIGQSDPFGRADPRASADWRDAPEQPAQHYDAGGYDDRYAAPQEHPNAQPQYAQDGYGQGGPAADGYAANHDTQSFANDQHHDGAG